MNKPRMGLNRRWGKTSPSGMVGLLQSFDGQVGLVEFTVLEALPRRYAEIGGSELSCRRYFVASSQGLQLIAASRNKRVQNDSVHNLRR